MRYLHDYSQSLSSNAVSYQVLQLDYLEVSLHLPAMFYPQCLLLSGSITVLELPSYRLWLRSLMIDLLHHVIITSTEFSFSYT